MLGVGGYFGYKMLFPSETSSQVAAGGAPAPTAAPTAVPVVEPPKVVVPAPQPPLQDAVSMKAPPAKPDSEAKAPAKDAMSADMAMSGSGKAGATAAAKMDASKATPVKGALPAGTPGASPPGAESPGPVAQAGAPAQPGQTPNRWQQMREAMARCAGDNFFKRVACEQGVGQQYCEGFWGKVPQCPSGPPNKDRGQ